MIASYPDTPDMFGIVGDFRAQAQFNLDLILGACRCAALCHVKGPGSAEPRPDTICHPRDETKPQAARRQSVGENRGSCGRGPANRRGPLVAHTLSLGSYRNSFNFINSRGGHLAELHNDNDTFGPSITGKDFLNQVFAFKLSVL